jgi:hypothetical protein
MKQKSDFRNIFLVLFDISGYTDFIRRHGKDFAHAEEVVLELLSVIISSAGSLYKLYEVSGDAVSFYVESDGNPRIARLIWDHLSGIFSSFHSTEQALRRKLKPTCVHCSEAPTLRLKAVLHHCPVVIGNLHGIRKIGGPGVILAHRLLKNAVQAREYVIATSDFYLAGAMTTPMGAVLQGEHCEGFGEVGILVWYPPGHMPYEPRPAADHNVKLGWR